MENSITVLVENLVYTKNLGAEHGLSLFIRHGGTSILFDAGQSNLLLANAQELDISLDNIDHIIVSHGHYDHTGGLQTVVEKNPKASLRISDLAFDQRTNAVNQNIGIPPGIPKEKASRITTPEEIVPGVYCMPRAEILDEKDTHFTGFSVFRDGSWQIDTFEDEQSLVIVNADSISVISGCSHRGITNIVQTAMNYFQLPVDLILGGFHLSKEPNIRPTIEQLRALKPRRLGVCHCTGMNQYCSIKQSLSTPVEYMYTGRTISLNTEA
ncbi:MBL fold metallo-hydrolase [Spirochaeta lutea]|uniref:Metallo-beta-lactamase domain-containing protein n=1 Tax=Spirochaeta lutea TaxID=1480694 RepID=A0A098R145_9SPIO|nr:MBL fold metallo-hydrolase [Spirochaeta lutea]KGE73820.1 hypothetical protein DC28_00975 [Spirochaeta lutea]